MYETQEKIKKALQGQDTIIIGANCTVEYDGRAEAYLPKGDRVIIIKPDKNLLVHQPTGTAPVNYMKTGTEHNIYYENKELYLKSKHSTKRRDDNKITPSIFLTNKIIARRRKNNPQRLRKRYGRKNWYIPFTKKRIRLYTIIR